MRVDEEVTCPSRSNVLHVTSVAESSVAGLGSTLVEAHLEVQLTLVGPQLLLGEGPLVLIRHLGSQRRSGELRMFLGDSSKRVQAQRDLGNVAAFEQVRRLEDFLLRDAVLLDGGLEPLDVFHQLEVGAAFLDLLNRARGQLVGQFAQDDAILEDVLVGTRGEFLPEDTRDPFENLLLLFLVAGRHSKCDVISLAGSLLIGWSCTTWYLPWNLLQVVTNKHTELTD